MEMHDDQSLIFPSDVDLVTLSLWPPDTARDADFLRACGEGLAEEVERFLRLPQDPNAADEEGSGALHRVYIELL